MALISSSYSVSPTQAEWLDSQGRTVQIASDKPNVLIFLAPDCPIVQSYMPTLSELEMKCRKSGISFFGVVSANDYSSSQVETFRHDFHAKFPILMDKDHGLATKYGATISPEAVVLNALGRTLYRGRIDNRFYDIGRKRNGPHSSDLSNVIEALARRDMPSYKETTAVGCDLNGAGE
jgi:thiol-disulfide isomerase/thioredoxin